MPKLQNFIPYSASSETKQLSIYDTNKTGETYNPISEYPPLPGT